MAATHGAMMAAANTLNHVKLIQQIDSAERRFNKLARTFTAQVEALKRYRSKGEQKVTVEHVHVHDGGQAIVGNVEGGVGSPRKVRINPMQSKLPMHQAPRCRARSKRTGSWCRGPAANGKSRLSDAWRKGRSTHRQSQCA